MGKQKNEEGAVDPEKVIEHMLNTPPKNGKDKKEKPAK
jgi:hypothetical protein